MRGCNSGSWRRRRAVLPAFVGQKSERYTKNVDVLRLEQTGVLVHIVRRATQAASDDLLTEKLAGERPQAHDVSHSLRVPSLRKHSDGNHILEPLARFPRLAHGIYLRAQQLGLLILGQLACVTVTASFLALGTDLRDRFLGGLGCAKYP